MARRLWYEVLGVGPAATHDEVRAAYLRLVKAWHPDRFVADPSRATLAEERLKEINAAYEDARGWRAAYDGGWTEEWEAPWAEVSEPEPFRLLFAPDSLFVRAVALVLALLFTFFAVANTMNALDLVIR